MLLLLANFCWMVTAHAEQKVILYGDENYPPYSFVENGQFKGMYVDLLTAAAKRMAPDYQIELQPRPGKRGLLEVSRGNVLGIFPPGLKKERTYIRPYSAVLYRESVVLFCTPEVMKSRRTTFPDDFAGLTVGVNAGFLLSARLIDAAKAGVVKLEEANGNESNLKKLAMKRIDCYASDRGAALYTAKKLASGSTFSGLPLQEAVELSGEKTYIGYSADFVAPFKADFIGKMNAALVALRANGTLSAIESNYLK